MGTYLLVSVAATVMYAVCLVGLARNFRMLPVSWQLLGYSGVPLALGGLGFVLRFWHPTPGPYIANSVYPFGSHLNAWAVSFGFMWLAFGLLFMFACFHAARAETTEAWLLLFTSWLLAWLPHGVIGVAFARSGANRKSLDLYTAWASDRSGCVILASGALIMFAHFGLSIGGFVATGLQIAKSKTIKPDHTDDATKAPQSR